MSSMAPTSNLSVQVGAESCANYRQVGCRVCFQGLRRIHRLELYPGDMHTTKKSEVFLRVSQETKIRNLL